MPLFWSRLPIISSEPCLPSLAKAPPTGPDWIHVEIKHDGFRVMARRDGKKVRLISRKGKDLGDVTWVMSQVRSFVPEAPHIAQLKLMRRFVRSFFSNLRRFTQIQL
jgi:hypothetical protein